jgi:molybdopterin molybdotransferase
MRTQLPAAEAQRLILDAASPLPPETCAAADAQGRVLAEPVVSRRTLPPFDVSAMDGYAVRSADLARTAAAHGALPWRSNRGGRRAGSRSRRERWRGSSGVGRREPTP